MKPPDDFSSIGDPMMSLSNALAPPVFVNTESVYTTNAATLTAADLMEGRITFSGGTITTVTTDTGTAIYNVLSSQYGVTVIGAYHTLIFDNVASGAVSITAGTGVSLKPTSISIPAGKVYEARLHINGVNSIILMILGL